MCPNDWHCLVFTKVVETYEIIAPMTVCTSVLLNKDKCRLFLWIELHMVHIATPVYYAFFLGGYCIDCALCLKWQNYVRLWKIGEVNISANWRSKQRSQTIASLPFSIWIDTSKGDFETSERWRLEQARHSLIWQRSQRITGASLSQILQSMTYWGLNFGLIVTTF